MSTIVRRTVGELPETSRQSIEKLVATEPFRKHVDQLRMERQNVGPAVFGACGLHGDCWRLGSRRSAGDVLSEYAQAKRNIVVEHFSHRSQAAPWEEQLLSDGRATPAELAACSWISVRG